MRALLLMLLIFSPAWAKPEFPLAWPTPTGFRKETIAFPLDFAPQLKYTGMEEIRFAPGFGKPQAPDYFSYSFVWLFDDTVSVSPDKLATDLQNYFAGLMSAVAKEKKGQVPAFPTQVKARPGSEHGLLDDPYCSLKVTTWDAFFTKQPLSLAVRVYQAPSLKAANNYQRVLYFEVSPRLEQSDVQNLLSPLRANWPKG